jgi:hypothetical protein
MLLSNRLNNINAQVEAFQEQIAVLQRQVTELQSHAQEVQGAEQAADSALVQVSTALQMLTAICPEEIATFKAALDALFNSPLQIAAATEPEPSPKPPAPGGELEVQDVEFEYSHIPPVDGSTLDTLHPASNGNGNGHNGNGKGDASEFQLIVTNDASNNGVEMVGEDELKQHKRPLLIRLANMRDIPNYNSKTRDELARLLAGKVSREDFNRQVNNTVNSRR